MSKGVVMNIRKADLDDIKTIVRIWNEFIEEHSKRVESKNPKLKGMNLRSEQSCLLYEKFVENNISSDNAAVFIAETDKGQMIGYIHAMIKDEIPVFELKRYGYIADLYVAKDFRGKGISSMLKDEIFSWFRDNELEYASVGFFADNDDAHDIYNKWGFFDYKIEAKIKL